MSPLSSQGVVRLILVLLISLITKPAFAVPAHQSIMQAMATEQMANSHSTPQHASKNPATDHTKHMAAMGHITMTSEMAQCHMIPDSGMSHCDGCMPGSSMGLGQGQCSAMENMTDCSNCNQCNGQLSQYSDLPTLLPNITSSVSDTLAVAHHPASPVSRQESVLRPPIG
ncbi:hypothetical protein C9I98_15145 [Photobacterium sanctipauli]|uniref:Uncharacterized protein n=1 Tax=Photobacterium sanctipauli TaxID=1342794 RepID=A0A2T3NR95_9GAMM|nr:hypothetical protein [Photobacterium sanctipauli]PSW18803.1 hypothetical protein C9I98_15145 [Photobacterium sanctipauli]